MKNRNLFRTTVCVLALTALSACSTRVAYEGTRLPPTEEAVLEGTDVAGIGGRTTVTVVDGRSYQSGNGKGEGATTLYLRPGRHSVSVLHMRYPFATGAMLWFEAKPGRRYLARAGRKESKLAIWIEDAMTGQTVGGIDENPIPLISDFKKDRP